ncbi:MAG TPA: tetratricopeptide repeat protein, partial [Chitinophagales bacterium]|nr:tetratricopeptide repeat protein [Chitinophagales bacterium]
IRCYANLRNFSDAQAIIAYLEEGNKFPKELSEDLALTKAYVNIQQKQYDKAIEPMKTAINLTGDKKDETRYTYILAQLYQLNGNFKYATQEFSQIAKLRPSYEMDFNARISLGKIYVQSGTGSSKEVLALLEEMSRNDRYEEFNDQIYYYMALVNLRQDKEEEAVKNLEASIKKSVRDANQKGLSFLKLGELSFRDQDYLTAQPSYDSAVVFLNSKFDTIDRVKEIKEVLDRVADETMIILAEDSLQRLAKMSEKERNKVIDNALSAIERKKEYEAKDTMLSLETQKIQELPGNNQAGSSGNWYFYNTSMKATGYNEFIKKWGNRALEDNWRRVNKKSNDNEMAAKNGTEELGDEAAIANAAETAGQDAARNKMLEAIPLTPAKMANSNSIIFGAYYNLGTIYKSDLHNIPKAIETFEKIATRFPENENVTSVYYNLYLLYLQTGNIAKAETYKQLVLQNPASAFAMVISDPEYLNKKEAKKNELSNYYASTYNYFVEENYKDVMQRTRAADSLFKPNPLQSKFELLEAMVKGKTLGRQQYIDALDSIVKKYPTGEVHDKAVEILIALGVQVASTSVSKQLDPMSKTKQSAKAPPYQMHPGNPHYLVVVFNTISPKTKTIADGRSDYNKAQHSLENYKVTPQLLDTKTQMIVVKQMKNRDAAMAYYNEVSDSETMFESVEDIGYNIFVIDDKNFPLFYQRKDVTEYEDFFYRNYENGDEEEEEEGE